MAVDWIRKVAFIGLFLISLIATMKQASAQALGVGDLVPHAVVDVVESDGSSYNFRENVDLADILHSHKRAVLFAVPGAFTPTCSGKHLPGFVHKAAELEAQGVEAIYCVAVNDKFVMRTWGEATEGCKQAKILKLVADGNGDFTRAMQQTLDRTSSRMGLRSQRYAAVIENGVISSLQVDHAGLDKSSADSILAAIPETCSTHP